MTWHTWLIQEHETRDLQVSAPIGKTREALNAARARRSWPRIEGSEGAPMIVWRGIHDGIRWNGTIQVHAEPDGSDTRVRVEVVPNRTLGTLALIPLLLVGGTGVLGVLATLALAVSGQLPQLAILTSLPTFTVLAIVPVAIGWSMRAIHRWTMRRVADKSVGIVTELTG